MNTMFKFPLDAKFLMFPVSFAVAGILAMTAKVIVLDPEAHSWKTNGEDIYETGEAQKLADTYFHDFKVKKFFVENRVKGNQTWGVFNNEFREQV